MDGLFYYGAIMSLIWLANVVQRAQQGMALVRVFLVGLSGMTIWLGIVALAASNSNADYNNLGGALIALMAFVAGTLSLLATLSPLFRRGLSRYFVRTSLTHYDPESLVHTTALVLVLLQIVYTLTNFYAVGGIAGVAESVSATPLTAQALIVDMLVYILVAMLGVGLLSRRSLFAILQRLGIRFPRLSDVILGIGVGVFLYIIVFMLNVLWQVSVSPETYQQQQEASSVLAGFYSQNIGIAFLMAIGAGVGEEILFRGALQPIFGVWAVTAFFTVLHSQYILTPASLIIFIVGLSLAWLRHRYSTTTAIIAHTAYNFLPFLLYFSLGGS